MLQHKQLPKLSEGFNRITFCENENDVKNAINTYSSLGPLWSEEYRFRNSSWYNEVPKRSRLTRNSNNEVPLVIVAPVVD